MASPMSSDEPNTRGAENVLTVWLATGLSSSGLDSRKLSPTDQDRLQRLRSPRKRSEFELSRALLQSLQLEDALHSTSHSGGIAAVGTIAGARALGIDLETHKPRDVVSLSRFAFHPDEANALAEHSNPTHLFYSLWVLKEACAKALNLELADALAHCVFRIDKEIAAGELPTDERWQACVWRVRPNMSLGAVVIGSKREVTVTKVEWPANSAGDWTRIVSLSGDGATAP
jgi:4'-phosphopantetheinyl transferase superfamily protein